MPLQIIGAGFGRTGTSSLKAAFEQLGFGPSYHMKEVFKNGDSHIQCWRDAAAGKPVNWETVFANYKSTTDFPASCFYKELMEAYPEAKVVLTIRDFDSWYKSASDTIYKAKSSTSGLIRYYHNSLRSMIDETIWEGVFHDRFEDKEYARQIFEAHIEEVKRHVPKERLLVYHVKEGWEPLCNFLNVPIPETEFPRLNDSKEFQKYISAMKTASLVVNTLAVAVPVAIAGAAWWYYNRRNE